MQTLARVFTDRNFSKDLMEMFTKMLLLIYLHTEIIENYKVTIATATDKNSSFTYSHIFFVI